MLNNNIKVKMPDKKTVTRKRNETLYIYYRTRAYRNEKGQPTNDTVLIGKKDIATGMLIPNKKYYEIYDTEPPITTAQKECLLPKRILDYGNNYLLDYILESQSVLDVLKSSFPNIHNEIITLAKYMICEGSVFYYCEDWCEKTYTKFLKKISSQKASEICKKIDINNKLNFFKQWIEIRKKEEYLAYDITSISSYSTGNDNIEWGYNRDGEKLPQLNMGISFGETSKIPVYYNVYPGSIPDKSYLDYMLRDSELLGLEFSKYVMDKGFFTEHNVKRLNEKSMKFIVSVPNHNNIPKKIILENTRLQYDHNNSLGAGNPYAKSISTTEYGFESNMHVFFDNIKFQDESEILFTNLEKREQVLSTMRNQPTKKNSYDKYFIFEEKDEEFSFKRNTKKINNQILTFGYFLILTTDLELASIEVLNIYRNKDVVEKCFDNLKNFLDMKRLRTHSKESSDGKIFIAFVALILRSIMENKIGKFNKKNNFTIEKILKELSKIKVVSYSNSNLLLNPITKKQRAILNEFGISEDDVIESLKNVRL